MKLISILVLFGMEIFYFSEGKPCPEKRIPHKTKCNAFYRCIELPSANRHFWKSTSCEEGLVYEPTLKDCVLPSDDWECNLGENISAGNKGNDFDDNNEFIVYGINLGIDVSRDSQLSEKPLEINANSSAVSLSNDSIGNSNDTLDTTNNIEFSGDGEYVDLSSHSLATVRESSSDLTEDTQDTPSVTTERNSKIDPKLTAHLQRLSQLVEGLKKTYQNKDTKGELQPHQLNAFLAHFNIRSKLDAVESEGTTNSATENQFGNRNKSDLSPETKVILGSVASNRFQHGHRNSPQLIIKRPDGSIIIKSPHQNNGENQDYQIANTYDYLPDPKLSDETMRTVLELSKQMVANPNLRQIFPNPAYYQRPMLHPMYVQSTSYLNNPFSSHDDLTSSHVHKTNRNKYLPPFRKNPESSIIHSNTIPVYASSSNSDKRIMGNLRPFGQVHRDTLQNDKRFSNRYENNKLITFVSQSQPSKYNVIHSPELQPDTIYSQEIPTAKPFDHQHLLPEKISEYYTPSPPLDDSNAYMVFESEQYPTIQYGNIPHPMNVPSSSIQSYYNADYNENTNTLFPLQIDYGKVRIRPNGQKFESFEIENGDDRYINSQYNHPHRQTINYIEDHRRPQYNYNGSTKKFSGPQNSFATEKDHDKLFVNIGGQFLNYDAFTKSILSKNEITDDFNVKLIKCVAGSRQPNTTDCTRYYVCSKKDDKVMSYSCPPFTGFNPETKLCDALTYANCKSDALENRYTVYENKRIDHETRKALIEAKRRRHDALKTRVIASLLQNDSTNGNEPATSAPMMTSSMKQPKTPTQSKRRKYYCKEGDKVPDQTSVYRYFVCFKNESGAMKGHKMTCPSGLIFCPKLSMCTLTTKCVDL